MLWVFTNNMHATFATNCPTVSAHFFYRCSYLHSLRFLLIKTSPLKFGDVFKDRHVVSEAIRDATFRQVIRTDLDFDVIPWHNSDSEFPKFSR